MFYRWPILIKFTNELFAIPISHRPENPNDWSSPENRVFLKIQILVDGLRKIRRHSVENGISDRECTIHHVKNHLGFYNYFFEALYFAFALASKMC